MKSTLKCLECDEEPPQESDELSRVIICHLGTQTEPVSHITQGAPQRHLDFGTAFCLIRLLSITLSRYILDIQHHITHILNQIIGGKAETLLLRSIGCSLFS